MKKYNAPIAQIIEVQAESLMAVSGVNDVEGQNFQFSNKRQSASNVIWGFDDEAE